MVAFYEVVVSILATDQKSAEGPSYKKITQSNVTFIQYLYCWIIHIRICQTADIIRRYPNIYPVRIPSVPESKIRGISRRAVKRLYPIPKFNFCPATCPIIIDKS